MIGGRSRSTPLTRNKKCMKRTILYIAVLLALALILWGCNPQEAGNRETTLHDITENGALQDTTVDQTQGEEIDLYPTDAPTDPPITSPTDAPTDPPTDPPTTPPTASPTTPPTDPPDITEEETEEQTTQGGIELPFIPG